jgi:hypothetical protein
MKDQSGAFLRQESGRGVQATARPNFDGRPIKNQQASVQAVAQSHSARASSLFFLPCLFPPPQLTTSSARGFLASLTMFARKPASTGTLPSCITRDTHRPPTAHPASKMEMSVKPCARRRAAACMPAGPAPMTTTFLACLVLLSCHLLLTYGLAGDADDEDGMATEAFLFLCLCLWEYG